MVKKAEEAMCMIVEMVSKEERLCLLAEEVAEMCDAAQEYKDSIRRRKDGRYKADAHLRTRLLEEMADTYAVILSLIHPDDMDLLFEVSQSLMLDTPYKPRNALKFTLTRLIHDGKYLREIAFKLRRTAIKNNPTEWTREHAEFVFGLHLPVFLSMVFTVLRDKEDALFFEEVYRKVARWGQRLADEAVEHKLTGGMKDEGVYEDRPEFLGK